MKIQVAQMTDLDIVKDITDQTIREIYSFYYPTGVVDFFLAHHNRENLLRDIKAQLVFLLFSGEKSIGTVTVRENEICRLFVRPGYQKKGFGQQLLRFAECKIFENYDAICLDSSLPAKGLYLKYGYHEISAQSIRLNNKQVLCYDVMEKCRPDDGLYGGKVFVAEENSANGEVNRQTIFYYHQQGMLVWAEYSGGDIIKGYLSGKVLADNSLEFYYQHMSTDGEMRLGKCHSTPVFLADGRLELRQVWQWLDGDLSPGTSVVIEKQL